MSKIKQAALYVTTDGQKFEDATEAAAHQSSLDNGAVITEFLDKHMPEGDDPKKTMANRTRARKIIELWLAEHPVEADDSEEGDE